MDLVAPDGFIEASSSRRTEVIQGMNGPAAWKVGRLQQHLAGIDISEACLIHDWMYAVGDGDEAKREADRTFLMNMLIIVDLSESEMLRDVRRQLAWDTYMGAVRHGWDGYLWSKDTRSYFAKVVGNGDTKKVSG